jgi:hypothetical protein
VNSDLTCPGEAQIRERIRTTSEGAKLALENLDFLKMMQLQMYQTYLDRYLLQLFVKDRAERISASLAQTLNGRSSNEVVQVFHISAHNYLKWVAGPKISFLEQPPLPPSLTGIPSLRQYLIDVLAPKKYDEIAQHVHVWIPNFIEKIKRVMNQDDRNEGLKTLAQAFDKLVDGLIKDLLSQAKRIFRKVFHDTFAKIRSHTYTYKQQVDDMIEDGFSRLRGPTWAKVLKLRGTLPPRASKAKGLEGGCSYNKDLSDIVASAFHNWDTVYTSRMRPMTESLSLLTR